MLSTFKTKIRSLDDRKLGPVEVERIREMWEVRCNRALRKAGFSENVTRHSLKAQGIDRPATQHLGPKAVAMTRNGCRPRKAETNRGIFSASRRIAEIESKLQHLKTHAHRVSHKQSARPQIRADAKSNLAAASDPHRSTFKRKTYGLAVRGKSRITYHGNRSAGKSSPVAACTSEAVGLRAYHSARTRRSDTETRRHFHGGEEEEAVSNFPQ